MKGTGLGALYPSWLDLLLILMRKPRDHHARLLSPVALQPPRPFQMQESSPTAVQASSVPTLTPHPLWTRGSCRRPSLRTRTPSVGWRSAWSCISHTRLSHTYGSDAAGDNMQEDNSGHKPRPGHCSGLLAQPPHSSKTQCSSALPQTLISHIP